MRHIAPKTHAGRAPEQWWDRELRVEAFCIELPASIAILMPAWLIFVIWTVWSAVTMAAG